MSEKHFILTSIGTAGDVFPYVGLAGVLRRRGHRVTLLASEGYRALAAENDVAFRALGSQSEEDELLGNPDFWHPLKGAVVAARWGSRLIRRHYELMVEVAGDAGSVLIASPGLLAARLVHETLGRPIVSLVLQPWMIHSCSAPPVMPMGLTLPQWMPRPIGQMYWRGMDALVAILIGRPLRTMRNRLGLPPIGRFFQWWLSPDLVIGMFPDWYGQPQADWPGQVKLAGFPMYDGTTSRELPPHVEAFLRAGPPPVAFTFGTGMMHAGKTIAAALHACDRLKLRAIFLTKYAQQLPPSLPPSVCTAPFAPFRLLFPRCAAIVHHGGIGTVAKALAAGVPQLVLPMAYDQTDNAHRVKAMGAGAWISPRRADARRLGEALGQVMMRDVKERCASVAHRFAVRDGLERAADLVLELDVAHRIHLPRVSPVQAAASDCQMAGARPMI